MRHGKKFNHLGRTKSHRRAMLSNMASSLIENKRITTSLAKGKALRVYIEPLLTKSKTDTTQNRRTVFSHLQSKEEVAELFRTVAPKIAERNGAYTRIIKTGFRLGDAAEMAMMELVDFNELYTQSEGKKTRRSRRGGAAAKAETTTATAPVVENNTTEEASEVKADENTSEE